MTTISGTLSGGSATSAQISGPSIYVDLTLTSGAVDVQWSLDGGTTFRTIATKSASEQFIVDAGGNIVRLNTTSGVGSYTMKVT